jgi:hypothetical protein
MATDFEKIVEQILRIVSGGDPAIESKIELAEIEQLVVSAGNDLGFEEWVKNKREENQSSPSSDWLMDYDVTLTPSPVSNEKIAILPTGYISIPKDRGVNAVRYIADGKWQRIAYVTPAEYTFTRSDNDAAIGDYLYTIKSGKIIIFATCQDKEVEIANINATLAVSNSSTIDNAKAVWIIGKVVPLLQAQMARKTDMVTDNNPTV